MTTQLKKTEELEENFLEYIESLEITTMENKDWFIFSNSDYDDSGRK